VLVKLSVLFGFLFTEKFKEELASVKLIFCLGLSDRLGDTGSLAEMLLYSIF
jgi:hypothetical protein